MPKSYKHKDETRVHIPSKEEAGYESESPKVKEGKTTLTLPKNPVVTRGQDPELFWMNKYGADNREDLLNIDIRSLYRHEHIAPENLINGLYRLVEDKKNPNQRELFSTNEIFGNALDLEELEKVSDYYTHHDGWTNRLIQGDSHLVMTSLLEREGMAEQVQMIYIDPPYGIKYNSNWQMKFNDRNVSESKDEHISGEPEMIKAFRDTWELGIHSYLSYLRDRLILAKNLLSESGSCFVQISDENVHLVRSLLDEVFGSENFVGIIPFYKTSSQTTNYIASIVDFILFYAKDKDSLKYRPLLVDKKPGMKGAKQYTRIIKSDFSEYRSMKDNEILGEEKIPEGWEIFRFGPTTSQGHSQSRSDVYTFQKEKFKPSFGRHWSYDPTSGKEMDRLVKMGRIVKQGKGLSSILLLKDNPTTELDNVWLDTGTGSFTENQVYVVQTGLKVIQRCMLMTTDPGDLILDPTCGSGTAAYVAEQWGRRWIAIDTSRIALNIAKTRLMTATYPYYHLYSDVDVVSETKNDKIKKTITEKKELECNSDVRLGFVYEEVPHITLKSLANNEPPVTESLFDKPSIDKKKIRMSGPFTVETLQNFEPVSPEELRNRQDIDESQESNFEQKISEHLKSAGVKTGVKEEKAVFIRIERLTSPYLNAEGFYNSAEGEKKAYFHIGPQFGTVSRNAVNEAVKECRQKGDADWLIILGFSFESDISNSTQTMSLGTFEVTKVRMHDDLMQEGLLKKDKKAGSFITIGEPDIKPHKEDDTVTVEICGLDIYDPIKDEVKPRSVADIAYWMVDDDYDGSNFVVKQVFFCGGNNDEFKKWQKGLSDLAKQSTKRNAEKTLKIEIDDEAFDRLYGFQSHPIQITKEEQKIAVRVISQFGEEVTKVMQI